MNSIKTSSDFLQISPIFKKKFAAIQRKRCTKHPFERIQIPYQIHPWLSPRFEHTIDHFRAEDCIKIISKKPTLNNNIILFSKYK